MSTKISVVRVCEACAQEFTAQKTTTRFCSKQCNAKFYKNKQRVLREQQSDIDTLKRKYEIRQNGIKSGGMMTVRAVAEYLDISRQAVYQLIENGRIVALHLSQRRTRIDPEALRAYLEKVKDTKVEKSIAIKSKKEKTSTYSQTSNLYSLADVLKRFDVSRDTVTTVVNR